MSSLRYISNSYLGRFLTNASYSIQIIDDVVLYTAELFSTNGNIFQSYDVSTDITVAVFKGVDDITSSFSDITWRKFNFNAGDSTPNEDAQWSNHWKDKKTITVTKDDVKQKCKIQCEVYTNIGGVRTLVASQSMTIIDVNDMKPSTEAPKNPVDGQIWVDSSVNPPIIKMWDASRKTWITIGSVAPQVVNLIRNSNFFMRNANMWTITKTALAFSTAIRSILTDDMFFGEGTDKYYLDNKWLKLRLDSNSSLPNGVSQTKDARAKSVYTLQNLLRLEKDENGVLIPSVGKLMIYVNSIDSKGTKTRLELKDTVNNTSFGTAAYFIPEEKQKFCSLWFETIESTVKVEVMFAGELGKHFSFLITNIMLANINKVTDWALAPEDTYLNAQGVLNFEDIFNALTDNGDIQGLFYDYEHGKRQLYVNGAFIQAYNLKAVNKDTKETTFYIDDRGNLTINATSLSIRGSEAASQNDISYKVELVSTEGVIFKNGSIQTTLVAVVYKGKDEITNQIQSNNFIWTRKSDDSASDAIWNNAHKGAGSSIQIDINDVYRRATFSCSISND